MRQREAKLHVQACIGSMWEQGDEVRFLKFKGSAKTSE